jgi:hypothetical protein
MIVRYKTTLAVAVLGAALAAPPFVHAQHQHGGAPPVSREDPASREHQESRLNLKDVLKAAERSLGALEKAVRAPRGPGLDAESAVRDYVNLVGWVERQFVDAEEKGVVDPRDAERARKSLAAQARRLTAMRGVEPGSEAARFVAQAQEAASAAVSAVDAASAVAVPQPDHQQHGSHRGGCGQH